MLAPGATRNAGHGVHCRTTSWRLAYTLVAFDSNRCGSADPAFPAIHTLDRLAPLGLSWILRILVRRAFSSRCEPSIYSSTMSRLRSAGNQRRSNWRQSARSSQSIYRFPGRHHGMNRLKNLTNLDFFDVPTGGLEEPATGGLIIGNPISRSAGALIPLPTACVADRPEPVTVSENGVSGDGMPLSGT